MAATIEHLVILMLENRSFDHMLGFLESADYAIDGLSGQESNPDSNGQPVPVNRNAQFAGDLQADPGHGFVDVNTQIFGNAAGTPGATPMQGFVTSYLQHTKNAKTARNIMNCFDPSKLFVLTTLAKAYAVCDRWFSSVPGPTIPNRAYAHAATSAGILVQDPDLFQKGLRTIYQLFDEEGMDVDGSGSNVTSKIFADNFVLPSSIPYLVRHQEHFGTMQDFFDGCASGDLPNYSFVEPRYANTFGPGATAANDQHPDHDVAEGEALIRDVYQAIRGNPDIWQSTVLVITYDEHGGIFDHVEPLAAVAPDNIPSTSPAFDFTRYGLRVPAVIVSAFTQPDTISSQTYDHTSFLAMARKLFLGRNWQNLFLTERDKNANTFDDCFDLTLQPRSDNISLDGSGPKTTAPEAAVMAAARSGNNTPNEHLVALTQDVLPRLLQRHFQ